MGQQADPRVPGSTRWREAVLAFVSGTVSIGIMGLMTRADQLLTLMAAVVLLVAQARVTHWWAGTPYPRWAKR